MKETKGSMGKILGFLIALLLLNGCAESVALFSTGASNGRIVQSSLNSALSYSVKKQTGKTPLEHARSKLYTVCSKVVYRAYRKKLLCIFLNTLLVYRFKVLER